MKTPNIKTGGFVVTVSPSTWRIELQNNSKQFFFEDYNEALTQFYKLVIEYNLYYSDNDIAINSNNKKERKTVTKNAIYTVSLLYSYRFF